MLAPADSTVAAIVVTTQSEAFTAEAFTAEVPSIEVPADSIDGNASSLADVDALAEPALAITDYPSNTIDVETDVTAADTTTVPPVELTTIT